MENRVLVPAIGLVLILLISLPMNLSSPMQKDSSTSPTIEQMDNSVTSYTPHAMIRTNGDIELYNLAIADNWTGYGNLTHPWIIQGYSITAQRPIEIGQTDYIFTIRDCLLTGTDPAIEFGIRLLDTEYSRIENCTISNAGDGIHFWNVRWGTIQNCTIFGCGDFGIYARYGQDCNIYDCVVRDNPEVGINVHESEHMTVENNVIHNNGHEGILVSHESGWTSDYLTLRNNTLRNNGGSTFPGLTILDTHHVTATDMKIYSNHVGVLVQDSDGFSLTDSQIYQNSEIGVIGSSANSGTFRNNKVHHNGDSGFVLDYSDDWEVTSNLVHDNGGYGFELYETTNSLFYYNDIGWNDLGNANETGGGTNDWNTVDTGNWWHDYTGGVYDILGGATDYYPSYSLVGESNGPLDVQWESVGAILNWSANALYPLSYEAYQNGSLVGSGLWDGSNIVVDINASALGFYECTLIAYHISGHNTTRTTSVTIGDWVAPTWDYIPQEIILLAGVDFFYQLAATDQSAIGGWGVDDAVNFAIGASGLLTNNVDLDVGEYELNVSVHDIYGNTRYIAIQIIVISDIPPPDLGYLFALSAIFGAIGAFLFVSMIVFVSKVREGYPE